MKHSSRKRKTTTALPKKTRGPAKHKKEGGTKTHSNPTWISTGLVELTQIQTRHELELDQIELDKGMLEMHREMWLKYGEAYVKTGIFPYPGARSINPFGSTSKWPVSITFP